MALNFGISAYIPGRDDLWAKLQFLFEKERYGYDNLNEVPDNPGVYLFFSEVDQSPIYVGRCKAGLLTRLKQHFYEIKNPDQRNNQQVQNYLVAHGFAEDPGPAVDYMKVNCSFTYIEEADFKERAVLENFATAVLRTPANLYNAEES